MRGFAEFKGYTTRIYYDGKAKTFTQRVVANTNTEIALKKSPRVRRKRSSKKPHQPEAVKETSGG